MNARDKHAASELNTQPNTLQNSDASMRVTQPTHRNTSIVSEIGVRHTGQRPAAGGRGTRADPATSARPQAPQTHAWRHGSSTQLRGASRHIAHDCVASLLSLLSSSPAPARRASDCGIGGLEDGAFSEGGGGGGGGAAAPEETPPLCVANDALAPDRSRLSSLGGGGRAGGG